VQVKILECREARDARRQRRQPIAHNLHFNSQRRDDSHRVRLTLNDVSRVSANTPRGTDTNELSSS